MINIDKFADKIESIIEKIKNLKYEFSNEDLGQEASQLKEECVTNLESFLELATEDFENNEDINEESED